VCDGFLNGPRTFRVGESRRPTAVGLHQVVHGVHPCRSLGTIAEPGYVLANLHGSVHGTSKHPSDLQPFLVPRIWSKADEHEGCDDPLKTRETYSKFIESATTPRRAEFFALYTSRSRMSGHTFPPVNPIL